MVVKGSIECPACGRPFRAWFQAGVKTVVCPVCGAVVDTAELQVQPEPVQAVRRSCVPGSTIELIWRRLMGYNDGRLAN